MSTTSPTAGFGGGRRELALGMARGVAAGAAGVALLLAAMITVTYLQVRRADPLNSAALAQLRAAYAKGAGAQLAAEIRALDLLARKAYFTSDRQIRAGSLLLLGCVLLGVGAARAAASLGRRPPLPGPAETPDFERETATPRRAVEVAGVLAALAAAGLGLAAAGRLDRTPVAPVVGVPAGGSPVPAAGSAAPAAAAGLVAAPPCDEAAALRNWPGFRGPGGNAIAAYSNAPLSWDGPSGKGIAWKVALPPKPGLNSPVVWGERLFLSGADAAAREIYAFSVSDGRLLWTAPVAGVPGSPETPPAVSSDTGHAAATVATDGRHVFAIFANGDLACVTVEGKPAWFKNLGAPENHYGHSSSLITQGALLIVQYDHAAKASVMAFDAATGREAWSQPRSTISWASPVCVNTGTRMELILADSASVQAYDPQKGTSLWAAEGCLSGEVAGSPAWSKGMVFVANEYAKACGIAVNGGAATIRWEYTDILPSVASPLATGELVVLAAADGRVACLDAATGKAAWEHEFKDGFYASPVLAGDRIYLLDMSGVMHVVKAARTFEELAVSALGEKTVATPAFLDGRVYIRGEQNLFAIGSPAGR